jgi:hypothetical protein
VHNCSGSVKRLEYLIDPADHPTQAFCWLRNIPG